MIEIQSQVDFKDFEVEYVKMPIPPRQVMLPL